MVETNEVVPNPAATARIPAIINPPFTRSNIETMFDRSFLAITKAMTDMITAPPPNTEPLVLSSSGRNPCASSNVWLELDENIIITSIPYNMSSIKEATSRAIATFVLVIVIYRQKVCRKFTYINDIVQQEKADKLVETRSYIPLDRDCLRYCSQALSHLSHHFEQLVLQKYCR